MINTFVCEQLPDITKTDYHYFVSEHLLPLIYQTFTQLKMVVGPNFVLFQKKKKNLIIVKMYIVCHNLSHNCLALVFVKGVVQGSFDSTCFFVTFFSKGSK